MYVCVCVSVNVCDCVCVCAPPTPTPLRESRSSLFGVEALRIRCPPRERERRTGSLDAQTHRQKMTVERIFDELGHFKRYQKRVYSSPGSPSRHMCFVL